MTAGQALQHRRLEPLIEISACQRAKADSVALRAWHELNRSRRLIARVYWLRAAAAVTADGAKIEGFEEQLRLTA